MEPDSHLHENEQTQLQSRQQESHPESLQQMGYEIIPTEEVISYPYRKAYDMMEKISATRIGQFFLKRGDHVLRIIETTAKWSVPEPNTDYRLQRPLPWLPFLMLIMALRLVRVWISIGAVVIGNAPIKPFDVVYFIQTRRRKLRALRFRGIKEIKRIEAEKKTIKAANARISLMSSLRRIFSSAICRPGQTHVALETRMPIVTIHMDPADSQAAKRSRIDDESDPNITVDEMLNKYADDSTTDDPDYVPCPAEEAYDTSETSSACEDEEEVAFGESTTDVKETTQEECPQINLNRSVEIENGDEVEMVPKPMIEVKQEILSDNENNENQPKTPYENGPMNGGENRETDVGNGY